MSINGFKWGGGLFSTLVSGSFPILQELITVSIPCFSLKCFYFPSPFPINFTEKKLKKKQLPASGTEFRFTCKLIVFCPPHERYTISKTYGDTHSQGHHSAFVALWNICCHTFSCSSAASPSKFKCSAEKQISRYMYIATLSERCKN